MSLQSIREQCGMTRRELAERSGVNFILRYYLQKVKDDKITVIGILV